MNDVSPIFTKNLKKMSVWTEERTDSEEQDQATQSAQSDLGSILTGNGLFFLTKIILK